MNDSLRHPVAFAMLSTPSAARVVFAAPATGGGVGLFEQRATCRLRSTTTLQPGASGTPQSFTGQQLIDGIAIPKSGDRRFFQLFEP